MASFLQRNHNDFTVSSASFSVSFAGGITAGSIIIVAGNCSPSVTSVTFSDGNGDTPTTVIPLTADVPQTNAIKYFCAAFLAPTTGTTTVTVTFGGANATYGEMFIWEGAGLTSPTVDKALDNQGLGTGPDTGSTGTLAAAVELAICYGSSSDHMTGAGTGWTNWIGGGGVGGGGEEQVTSATTALHGTQNTFNVNTDRWDILIATFYSGAAAVPVSPPSMGSAVEAPPYPTALRTWTQRAQTIVLSVPPPLVYHYPVPRGAEYPFGLYTLVNQRVQFTPQKTIVNYDWPVPRLVEYPTTLRTWATGPPPPTATMPPQLFDYPIPRTVEYPTALRTWTSATRTPQPPANYDYPLPRTVEYSTGLRTFVNQMVQFTPQKTVVNYDWPVPRTVEYPVSLRSVINQLTQFQTQSTQPPANYDYPVPRTVEYPTSLRTLINQVVQFIPAATPPPFNYSYLLAREVEYPTALRTWIGGVVPSAPAARPVTNFESYNRVSDLYPVLLRTWVNGAIGSGIAQPPANYDYPLPREIAYPINLRTVIGQRVHLQPQLTVVNYDYPVPQGINYPVALRTWINGVVPTTAAQPPFNYDYPVPRGAEYPIGLRTWVTGFQVQFQPTPVRPPITNYEWPYAREVVYPTLLRTFIGLINPANVPLPPPTQRRPLYSKGLGRYWKGKPR